MTQLIKTNHPTSPQSQNKHCTPAYQQMSLKTTNKDIQQTINNKDIIIKRSIPKVTSTPNISKRHNQRRHKMISSQILPNYDHFSSSFNQQLNDHGKSENLLNALDSSQNYGSSRSFEKIKPIKNNTRNKTSGIESNYCEKVSYRNHHYNNGLGVPYRKCHSMMQQKIVTIINKLKRGKNCFKEIETLIERSRKVSSKQLSNRYFISGIHVINKLLQQNQDTSAHMICQKIQEAIQELKNRIFQELDCIKNYQIIDEISNKPKYDQNVLIRKAYKIFRKKRIADKREALKQKAIQLSQWFIEQQPKSLDIFWMEVSKA